ncbi:MAG: antitoxin family protein [Acidobacteriota bacterium]|jgi:predicted DNA-binding antitoxin AbrB/MazE fold protein|nr:antitoxin family protein [Acidobacteriota bacterium]
MATIEAIYEKGVFRPTEKVDFEEGQKVIITFELDKKDSAENLLDIAIDTGIPDLSINIDHYLYWLPKQSEE